MKQNQSVYDTIRQDVTVDAKPRLIAEFNHNRYNKPQADNTPPVMEVESEPDLFPIDSIVGGLRPVSGCVKAVTEFADIAPPYSPQPPAVRQHIAEQEDNYKYWIGPDKSEPGPAPTQTINMVAGTFENVVQTPYEPPATRNLALDPRGVHQGPGQNNDVGWNDTRGFGTGGAGNYSYISNATDGPVGITKYVRKTWTTSPTDNSDSGFAHTVYATASTHVNKGLVVTAGTTYVISSYVRSSVSKPVRHQIVFRNAAGAFIGSQTTGTNHNTVAGEWMRIITVVTAPALATRAMIVTDVDTGGVWPVGATFDGTGLMITASAAIQIYDYFDGDGAGEGTVWDSDDFIIGWTGSPHNSASFMKYRYLADGLGSPWAMGVSSSEWSSSGYRSLRLSSLYSSGGQDYSMGYMGGSAGGMRLGMQAGKTYTAMVKVRLDKPQVGVLSAAARTMIAYTKIGASPEVSTWSNQAPNTAGVHNLKVTFSVPVGATEAYITFYNGANAGSDAWFDDFMLVEGNYNGPYFNGDFIDGDGASYAWSGVPHNSSSIKTEGQFTFPAGTTYPTNVNPQVIYQGLVKTNKIIIGLENSIAKPTDYGIYVQNTVGGAWTQIGDETNTTIQPNGQITLYWNGSAWGETRDITTYREIAGIQMRVSAINRNNRYFEMIQMGAHLEWDMTPYMTSTNSTFDLGDTNVMTPIGRISSNIGNISFFNALVDENDYSKGLLFNNENTDSPFYNLCKENVKFTLDYLYDATDHAGTNAEVIRGFTMFAEEDWGSEIEDDFSVSCRDSSKFLQEINAPETFYESGGDMSVGEIIWMLLDSVGFVDYNIDANDIATPIATNYFWCGSDQKVWEVLSSIADGTQTAIYFDEYGILQIKIKDIAFDPTQPSVWHLRGETSGLELADVASLDGNRKEIPNTVKINYRTPEYNKTASDNYISELVWEPETSPVVLRSSDLQEPFMIGDEFFMIMPRASMDWQYAGFIQVEGEVVQYEGKEYKWLASPSTTFQTAIVKTHEEYLELYHQTDVASQPLNHFTGRIKVKERGLWNTFEKDHTIQNFPYAVWQYENGARKTTNGFIRQGTESHVTDTERTIYEPNKSSVRLISNSGQDKDRTINVMYPGDASGEPPNYMGTRFIIREAGQKDHYGGICFCVNPTTGAGYYVEVRPEVGESATATSKRAVNVGIQHSNGDLEVKNGQGYEVPIVINKWHTLDVRYSDSTGDDRIWVWIDGKLLGRTTITGGDKRIQTDSFGMFIRGSSCFEFEYLYAYNEFDTLSEAEANWGDDVSFYDRVLNGYTANQSLNEFTTGTRLATRRVKNKNETYTERYDHRFFDEFVPVVHEMRHFDLKFEDKLPGKNVRLLATNEATAKFIDFRGTPFGAEFYAVNVSHDDVEVHGESDKLGILSQNLKWGETKEKIFKDEESVRVSGTKELEFQSNWIQTEGQVNKIGEWITAHWGFDVDEVTVEIFGNPLLQLTDIVTLTEPQSERVNERYYIINIEHDFNDGLGTTLRLRKVKS